METILEAVVDDYVVNVQVPITKEVQIEVCRMVPILAAFTFDPCTTVSGSASRATGCV
ncbi:MAG: hypothetical protein ACK5PB_23060 [Pirellula sp.]